MTQPYFDLGQVTFYPALVLCLGLCEEGFAALIGGILNE